MLTHCHPLSSLENHHHHHHHSSRKRKRFPSPSDIPSANCMVLIHPSIPPTSDPDQRDTDDYYLQEASKAQLLRLRRSHLIQLVKNSLCSDSLHPPPLEEIQNKNKDSLAELILRVRSDPQNTTLFPSPFAPDETVCYQINQTENNNPQASSSKLPNFVRTRVKSLPSGKLNEDPSQSSRQNKTCTRSRYKNLELSKEPRQSLPTVTRKTRSATQAQELSTKNQLFAQRSGSTSKGSWRSSPSADQDRQVHEQSISQTPCRLRNQRKTVKFIGQRIAGQTPIAYRTRRSSVHRTPSITKASLSKSLRTSGRKKRIITPSRKKDGSFSSTNHRVVTPITRKLRNGKIIRWKKQTSLPQKKRQQLQTEQEDTTSVNEDETESPDNDDIEEDESSTTHDDSIHSTKDSDTSISDAQVEPSEPAESGDESIQVDDADDQTMDSIVCDSEQEEDDTVAEDELIDLRQATSKRLLRLKRDNLVKLCMERELEAEGTKKDLVQNLLVWRNSNDVISPSSDACPQSSASSDHSEEEEEEEEETRPATTSQHSAQNPADGTCSRPIILDSDINQLKLNQKKTTGEVNVAQNKDDVGELLDLESLNLQDKEIHHDQLTKLEKIGSGGFKDVFKGIYKRVPVAIAEIRGHLTEMDLKELRILRDLRHDNIVRFIGVSVPGESRSRQESTTTSQVPIMIITELCTNGDLFDYIRKTEAPNLPKILMIFKDICKGLNYLHKHQPKIIHRDLKSSNVLITSKGEAKLNDFGLARIKNSTRSLVRSLVGTVNWQAPELWVPHPRYNEKVDVYSAALVLWEMLQWHKKVKRYPFEGQNEHAIYQDVGQKHLRPSVVGLDRHWGEPVVLFVQKLWAQSPADRPDMSTVLLDLDSLLKPIKNLSY